MVDESVVQCVRRYLGNLTAQGIPAHLGILFGSFAKETAGPLSDIDLLVISSTFDGEYPRELVSRLWRTAARTDSRIEPIPCGEQQWREDTGAPILEIVRKEGIPIELKKEA